MPVNTYPYTPQPLPYAYNALEPYIDTETMRYHHDKHYQAYADHLNKALEPYPKLQKLTLEKLLTRSFILPYTTYEAILHNGGGTYNHQLFFQGLAPAGEDVHKPKGYLAATINKTFGSFETFQKQFSEAALDVFGSGWVCLVMTPARRLKIMQLANQETALRSDAKTVILFDVWEHAYYLKYKNARADYVQALWKVVKFPEVRF